MTWQKKPAAPDSFNLADAFGSLITGDPNWGWLASFVPLIPPDSYDTASFCALGPPPDLDFDPSVFAPIAGRTPAQTAINLAARVATVIKAAQWRVYEAYCENNIAPEATPGWHDVGTYEVVHDHDVWDETLIHLPPFPDWASQCRVHFLTGPTWRMGLVLNGGGYQPVHLSINPWVSPATGGFIEVSDGISPDILNNVSTWRASNPTYHLWPVVYCRESPSVGSTWTFTYQVYGTDPGGSDDWGAPVADPPEGFVAPATRTYDTIADLGAELDRQEFKLDVALSWLRELAAHLNLPGTPALDDIPVLEDTPIDIGDASAIIVALSGVPPFADVEFASPEKIGNVGRVNLGTADGWLAPIDLEVNPMVLAPIPPGVTRVQVNVKPPATATVKLVHPPK